MSITPVTGNAMDMVVKYQFAGPVGGWQIPDNGVYTVSIEAGKASAVNGKSVIAGTLGSFTVSIGGTLTVTNANASGAGSFRAAIETAGVVTQACTPHAPQRIDSQRLLPAQGRTRLPKKQRHPCRINLQI